jgi:Alg9-like mannosyltransferase family
VAHDAVFKKKRPYCSAYHGLGMAIVGYVESTIFQCAGNNAARSFAASYESTSSIYQQFTFVSFPIMLRYIADMTTFCMNKALLGLILVGIGFLGTATGVIYADVVYYKGADKWTSYITPWNALLYNSKVENLQDHGLHPRWTHALVNMFLLYGPLAFHKGKKSRHGSCSRASKNTKHKLLDGTVGTWVSVLGTASRTSVSVATISSSCNPFQATIIIVIFLGTINLDPVQHNSLVSVRHFAPRRCVAVATRYCCS